MATDKVIRCRGLPYSITVENIQQFFSGLSEEITRVVFVSNNDGRPTGEAYVEFANEEDYQIALAKDQEAIGKRYIELFPAKKDEMVFADRHNKLAKDNRMTNGNMECVVRLRGLPYSCWEEDIIKFFNGCRLAANGVFLLKDRRGKPTGECFVQFADSESFEMGLERNKQHMGARYVEVFPSNLEEMRKRSAAISEEDFSPALKTRGIEHSPPSNRYSHSSGFQGRSYMGEGGGRSMGGYDYSIRYFPYSNGPSYKRTYNDNYDDNDWRAAGKASGNRDVKHSVYMRGLPYKATQEDIIQFFAPLLLRGVQFMFESTGRPSGEASVDFGSHADATTAMRRNRSMIGDRYIELYLKSEPDISQFIDASSGYYGANSYKASFFANNHYTQF